MTTRLRTFAAGVAIVAAGSLAACSQGSGSSGSDNGSDTSSSQQSDQKSSQDNGSSGKAVNRDEAGKIATKKYGGTIKNVESDHYNGKPAWEVEVRDSKQGRIEVKVEKSTGKIMHMEQDEDSSDDDDDAQSQNDRTTQGDKSGKAVNRDEAGKIATKKYGGTIKNVESDHYNGKPAWEVEVRDSKQGRIEVKVEKSTGKIMHMEKD